LGHGPVGPGQQHERAAAGCFESFEGLDRHVVDQAAVEAGLSADRDPRHERRRAAAGDNGIA